MSKEQNLMDNEHIETIVTEMARQARWASRKLVALPPSVKDTVLLKTANALMEHRDYIAEQNQLDLEAGRKKGLSSSMLDRLSLNDRVLVQWFKGWKK